MTCNLGDVIDLLPGYDTQQEQMQASLQKAIDNASVEVQAELASLYPPTAKGPIFSLIVCYRAVANLLASVMSSNNEMGETKLSKYYNDKAQFLIDGLLDGSLIAIDDAGQIIPTETLPDAASQSYLSLLTYSEETEE